MTKLNQTASAPKAPRKRASTATAAAKPRSKAKASTEATTSTDGAGYVVRARGLSIDVVGPDGKTVSKHANRDEAVAACAALEAGQPPAAAAAPTAPPTVDVEPVTITVVVVTDDAWEAATPADRHGFMTSEAAAAAAALEAGQPAPATPWLTTHYLRSARALTVPARVTGPSRFSADAEAALVARLVAMREAGMGWPTIAKTLNEDGTPTAKGGRWASSTVIGVARRHGIPTTRPA